MPQGIPVSGEKYIHFKKKLYQVVTIAIHSETGEKLVIYQALYGDFKIYARPLDMFTSEVDHKKYPQVEQRYRFQLVENQRELEERNEEKSFLKVEEISQEMVFTEEEKDVASKKIVKEKDMTELLMDFYDAPDYQKKYDILLEMKDGITDIMINNMAVVLDVVIAEGNIEKRYEELKKCIRTYQKYELRR